MPNDHEHVFDATPDFQPVADVFKLLSDTNRLRIFWLLCRSEECVVNISALMNMSSPAVSHHLKQLKAGGLITGRRNGKEVYYKSVKTVQTDLIRLTTEGLIKIACQKIRT